MTTNATIIECMARNGYGHASSSTSYHGGDAGAVLSNRLSDHHRRGHVLS